MPRRRFKDYPGAWWHVTNRGIAKRSVFENLGDVERFLDLLADLIRRGVIEVHAYCVMTTHFHLLVRSVRGELPNAMHWLLLQYTRWFNRGRKRDGSLFRGRYKARLIEDPVYWENVVRYIDMNPVSAGLCRDASDYPFGSAAAYRFGQGPGWLVRHHVEERAGAYGQGTERAVETYDRFMSAAPESAVRAMVEVGLESPRRSGSVPVLDLIRSASRRQQAWFAWKADLADGTECGFALAGARTVNRVCDRLAAKCRAAARSAERRGLRVLRAGLLRDLVACTISEISEHQGVALSTTFKDLKTHERLCMAEPTYAELVERAVGIGIRRSMAISSASVAGGAREPLFTHERSKN